MHTPTNWNLPQTCNSIAIMKYACALVWLLRKAVQVRACYKIQCREEILSGLRKATQVSPTALFFADPDKQMKVDWILSNCSDDNGEWMASWLAAGVVTDLWVSA